MQTTTAALSLVLLAHSVFAQTDPPPPSPPAGNGTSPSPPPAEESGLGAGAVAAIVIGILVFFAVAAFAMYMLAPKQTAMIMNAIGLKNYAPKVKDTMPTMEAEAATAGRAGGNNLPMMAMRVPGDDSL